MAAALASTMSAKARSRTSPPSNHLPDVTIITGASSGLGRELAKLLAADGDHVAVVARRTSLLEELAAEIEAAGGRAIAVTCDVTDLDGARASVALVERELGPITRLVANAGGGDFTPVDAFRARQVEGFLQTNVVGTANFIEAVLPGMLSRGTGHLVVTSSLAGYRGLPGGAAYSAAKAALTNMMESLRIDLKPRGIDVTIICPGFVHTAQTERNAHTMPFMLDVPAGARHMHRAIRARKRHYAFPKVMGFATWLGSVLPAAIYDTIVGSQAPTEDLERAAKRLLDED